LKDIVEDVTPGGRDNSSGHPQGTSREVKVKLAEVLGELVGVSHR